MATLDILRDAFHGDWNYTLVATGPGRPELGARVSAEGATVSLPVAVPFQTLRGAVHVTSQPDEVTVERANSSEAFFLRPVQLRRGGRCWIPARSGSSRSRPSGDR